MNVIVRGVVLAMALTGAAGAAPAPEDAGDRVLKSFANCRALAAPDARLACLEKEAAVLEAAVTAREVRIVDRRQINNVKRSLFGFALPKIALFGDGDRVSQEDESDFTKIDTTIASARRLDNERVELRLADGAALWRTTDPMPYLPRNGAKIQIRKGTLGNYLLSVAGERTVRGMRVQ